MVTGMKPQKIRALLIEEKETQTQIARDLRITQGAVARVIDYHFVSKRIREAIANKVRVPYEKMWGKKAA